jgi:outer membrane receptor protein involved in Fe transport
LNLHLGSDYAFGDHLWISKAGYYTTEYITEGVAEQQEEGSQSRANTLSFESFVNLDYQFTDETSKGRELLGGLFAPTSINTTVGINATQYGVNSTTLNNQSAYGLAGFVQFEAKTLGGLSLLPGFRYDLYKANNVDGEKRFSPKMGLNYRPTDELAFRISTGSGFRVPTLTERFINSRMAGFTIIPNDSLRPERSRSTEFGAMYRDDIVTLDAAVFASDYEEMIEPMFVGDKIQFRNITRARQEGHEEFVEVRPFASELVKARLGYTYVRSEDLNSESILPYRPRHLVLGRAEWNPEDFAVSADFRYISAYEATDSTLSLIVVDGDVRNEAYVLDARASLDLKTTIDIPLKLTFQVQNLLNYYYVEIVGNMGPLRSYSLRLETSL